MLTVAPPDRAELDANAAFEALMWAMSRPGDIRTLPAPGLAGIVETLLDLECTAFAEDPALRARIAATGARLSDDIGSADHVFLHTLAVTPPLSRLRVGTALYPDQGATLVAPARIGEGTRLRLSGPGIDGVRELALDVPAAFWAWRSALSSYPEGFELILVDGARTVAIPRSSAVEVL